MNTLAGFHPVREALEATPERVRKILLSEGRLDARAQEILALARAKGVPVYREKPRAFERLAPGAHHQGVLAEVAPLAWWDFEELLARAPEPALLVALDQLEDPRNFGAVARTADGAGVFGVIVPRRNSAPPSPAAVAASAGALLHTRLARVTNLSAALARAKEKGVWVVGLAPDGRVPWYEFDYRVPVMLVLGSEGKGLRRRVAETCDTLVSLPQLGRVSSLNLSVAAGIVLYEALRQRATA
jgi:23S rRNA (guanosine2251-2'-O)-methyltransferase